MYKYILCCLCLLLIPVSAPAFEGLQAVYADLKTGGVLNVTAKDAQNARIDYELSTSYILAENGTVWRLEDGADGWYLTDYAEALARYKETGDPRLPHADIGFKNTGRTEEVGGLTGAVFEINDRRARITYEAVLCDDAGLFTVSQVVLLLYSDLNASVGERNPVDKIIRDTGINYGVLRLGDLLEFRSIEPVTGKDALLELPSNLIF